ncbi:MAG: MarR family winged helix-turn-helix transcriptional regulator [Candidatus Paceibacterota bacterium]
MKSLCDNHDHAHSSDDFSRSFMYSIHQMYFLIEKHLEHALFKKKTISFSQFLILVGFRCSPNVPVSQSVIAERLNLTEATVSRHISSLVASGLLSRTQDTTNRRKHIIDLTTKGKKVFDGASTLIHKELTSIFSPIQEKDRKSIVKNFTNVLSLLEKK